MKWIGKKYKIQMKNKIFYTAVVLEDEGQMIRVKTIRDEDLILNKIEIVEMRLIEDEDGSKDRKSVV